jgi:hypothetical protein
MLYYLPYLFVQQGKARQGWFTFEYVARIMIESDDPYRVCYLFGKLVGVDEDHADWTGKIVWDH